MTTARVIRGIRVVVSRLGTWRTTWWLRLQGVGIDPGGRVFPGARVERQGGHVHLGSLTTVHRGAGIYAAGGRVTIGKRCSINPGCLIYGHGGLTIGDDVRIAGNVVIVPADHQVDNPDVPIRAQGETRRGIVIGDDVWIAAGAIVLDGVSVANGSVIGAGAVVTRSTERNGIYVGNPARLLRFRGEVKAVPQTGDKSRGTRSSSS